MQCRTQNSESQGPVGNGVMTFEKTSILREAAKVRLKDAFAFPHI